MPTQPAAPTPLSQNDSFYKPPWSRETETLVLGNLYNEFVNGNWEQGEVEPNLSVVDEVYYRLSGAPHNLTVPRVKYHLKVNEWYWRYVYFSSLLNFCNDVWYDEEANLVYASNATWSRLSQIMPSLLCYWPEGELNYKFLKALFHSPEDNE